MKSKVVDKIEGNVSRPDEESSGNGSLKCATALYEAYNSEEEERRKTQQVILKQCIRNLKPWYQLMTAGNPK